MRKIYPFLWAVIAIFLLCSAPLTTVYAAPASQKSTAAKKKTTTTKTTTKKKASTQKKPSTKKKNTARTENRPQRQTMVVGQKPTTAQADNYDDVDSALERKKADDLLMSAMGLLGVSYRFGGSNPASGLDCSGFIQYIFREAMNVNLPRTSAAMAEVGIPVEKSNLKPGDLVFFARAGRRVGHVGMYIGDGKFIHAPRTGKSIEIQNLNKAYYVKNYAGARRIPNANRAARFVQ